MGYPCVVSVSWTEPVSWRQSLDHVLVIEFLKAGSGAGQSATVNDNPYGEGKSKQLMIKKDFDEGRDGVIKVKINRKLPKYKTVTKLRVKVINQDYETSKYSRVVPFPDLQENNDEDLQFLWRESRTMGTLT